MSKERELLTLVLSYAENLYLTVDDFEIINEIEETFKNIKELLAQPEHIADVGNMVVQEPVGIVRTIGGYPDDSEHVVDWLCKYKDLKEGDRLYLAPQTHKPITGIEISNGFKADDEATHPYSYWAGINFAEKYYGIGVDDEN